MTDSLTHQWTSYHFRAMGSHISVWLETDEERVAQMAFAEVQRLFARFEQIFSRFLPNSELSRVNECAGEWIVVSSLFWQVLEQALVLAEETEGVFDPTLLRELETAGYDRSFELLSMSVPSVSTPFSLIERPVSAHRWRSIERDEARRAIRLPKGMGLDLGGIVKGVCAETAVSHLSLWGACLIDAGGDLVAGDPPVAYTGWPVSVARPTRSPDAPEQDLVTLWLANATLATSGTDYRHWQRNGRLYHHIIDPRTGEPANSDAITATVCAPSAARAEAWATASLVLGLKQGAEQLAWQGLPGLLISQDGLMAFTPQMYTLVQFANT